MWIYVSYYLVDQFILLEVFWEIFSNELGHSVVLTHKEHVHAGHHDDDEDGDDDDDNNDDDAADYDEDDENNNDDLEDNGDIKNDKWWVDIWTTL